MSDDERMPHPADPVGPQPSEPPPAAPEPAAAPGPASADGTKPEPPAAPEAAASGPTVAPVSPDVDVAQESSPLPGAHRGGFLRLPTAPVAVTVQSAPDEPGGEFNPDAGSWADDDPALHRGLAGWALAFGIVGLLVSLFVGWGFPIGLVAVVSGIIALRRPLESRAIAVWAVAVGTMSILYSAGWLLYAAFQANLLG